MKGNSSIILKLKASALMLCVFFMMINTCPVRSLLASALNPPVESSIEGQESKSSKSFVYGDLRCADGKVTKAALLDFSKSGKNLLFLPLLTVISLYLSLSVLSLHLTPFKTERKRLLNGDVPLFLKNRSIII